MAEKFSEEGYKRLAAAIVEQACKDAMGYPAVYKRKKSDKKLSKEDEELSRNSKKAQREEVRRFFCDENSLFAFCMPHTDGKMLLNRVYDNFKKYGNYMPPDPNYKRKKSLIILDGDTESDYEQDDDDYEDEAVGY